jgi:two-component system response regulator AtoC
MLRLFEQIERAGRSDATVLIRGASGTGKELCAQAIHRVSPRRSAPFQAINCAVLTRELLASELFGHVRGAFTGAVRDHVGLFARADGGTIFLDEIAELPLDLQARLLRVLENKAFTPVGSAKTSTVDVRILSATLKSLREQVEQRQFREDLMYRVRVVPIFLPALVERTGDVAALTWHFIDEYGNRYARRITSIEERAERALLAYAWPGNVRELRNVIEHAFVMGEGPVLRFEELTPELRGEPPQRELERVTGFGLERQRLITALERARGQKQRAADLLKISRSTLWRKLREHGLERR